MRDLIDRTFISKILFTQSFILQEGGMRERSEERVFLSHFPLSLQLKIVSNRLIVQEIG